MATILIAAVAAGIFGLISSMLINWTSARSPLWNIGFFLVLVLIGAAILLIVLTVVSRRLTD
jgi:hypothetical protein